MASKEKIIEKIELLTRLANDYGKDVPEWRREQMRREIHALEWAIGKRRNWS